MIRNKDCDQKKSSRWKSTNGKKFSHSKKLVKTKKTSAIVNNKHNWCKRIDLDIVINQNQPAYKVIYEIAKRDLYILELWQRLIYNKLNNTEEYEKLRITEIAMVMRECTSRYAIFGEKPRHDDYLYDGRDISELSEAELLKIIKWKY